MSTLGMHGESMFDPAIAPMGSPASDPANMPEIMREITMIRGALSGVDRRWEDLLSKVSPVRMQLPEMVDPHLPSPDSLAVYSPLGKQLREIYDDVSRIESRIAALTAEIGL